jgi:hypothetical protein
VAVDVLAAALLVPVGEEYVLDEGLGELGD